jgi:OmpA-OmpF porin, OOP family
VRFGVLATLLALTTPAVADRSRFEASGFLGVEDFSEDTGLGNASAATPEQRPQTAPTVGARLTYLPLQTSGDVHLALGVEAELSFTPAWTGYGFDSQRPSYFAPVFGYRGNLMLRLGGTWLEPHVLVGGGAVSVASSSPHMAKETDGLFAWGVGSTFSFGLDGWQLRVDGRQTLSEALDGELTAGYELLVGVGMRFGGAPAKPRGETLPPPPPPIVVTTTQDPNRDSDGDGIPDRLDACPDQAGVPNARGCPERAPDPDPDKDGIVGSADKCPDQPEDFDGFEDQDGCPDDDNDKDGIADASDRCPNEPETFNGFQDDDGCPDQLPPKVLAALAAASEVKFDANRARVTSRAKTVLDQTLAEMLANPKLKVRITARPEAAGARHVDLAQKRAENLRWYLVEQGVSTASLSTAVGPVAAKGGPIIVLSVVP